jgi:hypothetical protein
MKKKEEGIYWARQCDVTLEGMNEGYCIDDGMMYVKYEKDMLEWLRSKDWEFENEGGVYVDVNKFESQELLEWAYNEEIYYWTEWFEKEDVQYSEVGGKLIEIELN